MVCHHAVNRVIRCRHSLFPADVSIAELYATGGLFAIGRNYVKYIGVGAVACGGIISLIKSLPLIVKTFGDALKGFENASRRAY